MEYVALISIAVDGKCSLMVKPTAEVKLSRADAKTWLPPCAPRNHHVSSSSLRSPRSFRKAAFKSCLEPMNTHHGTFTTTATEVFRCCCRPNSRFIIYLLAGFRHVEAPSNSCSHADNKWK